ncbi:MAG: hypothetical protein RL387_904 [Bacteroidota bacterium]
MYKVSFFEAVSSIAKALSTFLETVSTWVKELNRIQPIRRNSRFFKAENIEAKISILGQN